MIAFDLICCNGHKFECWFKNNDSFEEQKSYGVITCPVCRETHVEKALTSFGIRKHGSRREAENAEKTPVPIQEVLRGLRDFIDKNFEDVGLNFASEALKIHYGEAEKRNIRGMTLPNEEKVLEEEGVPFMKIPLPRQTDN